MADGIGSFWGVVIDVSDLDRAVAFWSTAAGLTFEASLTAQYRASTDPRSGTRVVLQSVPEGKAGKNRVHLDLTLPDVEEGVRRIEALGGRLLNWVHDPGMPPYVVCADPDGNEFCLIPA